MKVLAFDLNARGVEQMYWMATFLKRVAIPDDYDKCWEWLGQINDEGYGYLKVNKTSIRAHRRSYQLFIGPIPDDLPLDHLCSNRSCVNPTHLDPVTAGENRIRAAQRQTHCRHGHEYTPENTYRPPNGGGRQCRICKKDRDSKCVS